MQTLTNLAPSRPIRKHHIAVGVHRQLRQGTRATAWGAASFVAPRSHRASSRRTCRAAARRGLEGGCVCHPKNMENWGEVAGDDVVLGWFLVGWIRVIDYIRFLMWCFFLGKHSHRLKDWLFKAHFTDISATSGVAHDQGPGRKGAVVRPVGFTILWESLMTQWWIILDSHG